MCGETGSGLWQVNAVSVRVRSLRKPGELLHSFKERWALQINMASLFPGCPGFSLISSSVEEEDAFAG